MEGQAGLLLKLKSLSIEIESSRKYIPKVEKLLYKANEDLHLASEKFHNLLVAVSELVLNAIIHGNKESPSKKVKVTAEYNDKKITVKILDEGFGFNIDKIPDPSSPENVYKETGRGIYIVKQLIENFEYKMTPQGSLFILTITK